MIINYVLGVYVLMYRKSFCYFTGKTRAEVIEKAMWYLSTKPF